MDSNNTIPLYEVARFIDGFDADGKPNKFSITWCTLDKKKETGGKQVSAENCIKVVGKKNGDVIYATKPKLQDSKVERNPNHYAHQTRNILVNGTLNIRKIHLRLIERFNGKVMTYG